MAASLLGLGFTLSLFTTNCSICTRPFKSVDKKVRDHGHLNGKYRSPSHNACNLNYHDNPKKVKIPCIIQNLKVILFLCYSYFHICHFLKLILIAIFMVVLFLILIAIFFFFFFFSFYEFCKFYFIAIHFVSCNLRFYAVSSFF